jgi:hypothetical protein
MPLDLILVKLPEHSILPLLNYVPREFPLHVGCLSFIWEDNWFLQTDLEMLERMYIHQLRVVTVVPFLWDGTLQPQQFSPICVPPP